jgi:hypothetical protein
MLALELCGNRRQLRVIVRPLVSRNAAPVDGFRGGIRLRQPLDDGFVVPLGIRPLLPHEGDASEAEMQLRQEFVTRQIAFTPPPFAAGWIEDDDRRRPENPQSVKHRSLLFDVGLAGDEMLLDERGNLRVVVRFGFQPNASASSRRCSEVREDGLAAARFAKRLIDILLPTNRHTTPPG